MESYGSPQGRALTRASRARYSAPAIVPVLAPRGALYVAWQGQEKLLEAMQAPGLVALDARAALERVPVLREAGLLGAWYEADAMDSDVHALLHSSLVHARSAGAQLWTAAELSRAQRDGGDWTLTMADGRQARAAVLVDAAGAWADVIAARCGIAGVQLQPCRRSAFTFDAPAGVDVRDWPATCSIEGSDESWYFKPDAGRLLGSPANADPVPPHDVLPEALDIASGIAQIEEHTTLSIRRPRSTWAGLRSFVPDGEMVIGFDGSDGFFWLAGHGGWGIQSAAGAAMLAEALISGLPLPEALRREGVAPAAVSPARLR